MQSIKGVAVQNLNSVINLRSLPVIKEGNKTKVEKVEIEMKNVSFSYDDTGRKRKVRCKAETITKSRQEIRKTCKRKGTKKKKS